MSKLAGSSKALKRILMCAPAYFKVNYTINPWMNPTKPVNRERALKQWETLRRTIEDAGAEVVVMEPSAAEQFPDLVFTANAALIRRKRAYIANFFYSERKGEELFFRQWLEENGYETVGAAGVPFEGSGDALWAGEGRDQLFCGVGPRADARVLPLIASRLADENAPFKAYGVRLIDPRFYSIDTCLCPLEGSRLALYYPPAFDALSRHNMANQLELIPIDEIDAERFACNALVVERNVIMHEGAERTARLLEKVGFRAIFVDMSEFLKAGGSVKSCSLELG